MDELTIPFLGRDRADLQYPVRRPDAVWRDARHGQRLVGHHRRPAGGDRGRRAHASTPSNRHDAPFLPEQALPLQVALAAFTAGSAYVNHDVDGGSLAVGQRADLALIDRNLFAVPSGHVADARVEMTIASGRVVHESESA